MVPGTIIIGGPTGMVTTTTEIMVTYQADITILGVITVLIYTITGHTMEITGTTIMVPIPLSTAAVSHLV